MIDRTECLSTCFTFQPTCTLSHTNYYHLYLTDFPCESCFCHSHAFRLVFFSFRTFRTFSKPLESIINDVGLCKVRMKKELTEFPLFNATLVVNCSGGAFFAEMCSNSKEDVNISSVSSVSFKNCEIDKFSDTFTIIFQK